MGNGSFPREIGWAESLSRADRFLHSGTLRTRPGMAKFATLAVLVVTMMGCAAHQGQVVETLPQPNFNGPMIAQAPPPAPALPPVPQYTPASPRTQGSLSGPQA